MRASGDGFSLAPLVVEGAKLEEIRPDARLVQEVVDVGPVDRDLNLRLDKVVLGGGVGDDGDLGAVAGEDPLGVLGARLCRHQGQVQEDE